MALVRDVWEVREEDFPHGASIEAQGEFLLRYAILAPSSKNTQPWLFSVDGDLIEFSADETRWQPIADADERELHLSVGCALETFLVAAIRFGFGCKLSYFPEEGRDDLVARVRLLPRQVKQTAASDALFYAITARATDTQAFTHRPIANAELHQLLDIGASEDIRVVLSTLDTTRERVESLMMDADLLEYANPEYRDELARLIAEGSFGSSWLIAQLGQLATRHLNMGQSTARKHKQLLLSSPAVGIIASRGDRRIQQVRSGQLFQRFFLQATSMGLSVHPMSQALHFPELKRQVGALLDLGAGEFPQQVFRAGYGEARKEHTPRRPLSEVLQRRAVTT